MAPKIPSSKLTLSCPLFAADFDPRNNGFLLVAGGGGEGRSGVGNKIALLNTFKRNEISEVVDIELSRDEDSVTSLAAAHASDKSIVALAGINSSMAEQKKDNNQHLRSFRIDYPPRRSTGTESDENKNGTTTPLSRSSIFRTKGATKSGGSGDTYQRILRLSPWKDEESPRVAAIATGLAPSGEIVFFNNTSTPGPADVIGRIRLDTDEEAEDVDLIGLEDEKRFLVAYTNGVDICLCQISSDKRSNASPDVQSVYTTPLPDGRKTRPKFRSLRFLSPTTLLLLQNAPDRQGCDLVVLDLRPATTSTKDKLSAQIVRRKRLRRTIKIGLNMDICNLGPSLENEQQTIIAVSGSDISIELLTLDYSPRRGYGKIRPYTSLYDVHPFSMTKICFSHFTPPKHPVSADVQPQYVKLASVSMGNTVVVHTLPLKPLPPSSRTPRYVLVVPGESELLTSLFSGFLSLLSIFIVCFLVQAFTEIRGVMPPYLGATEWLPPDVRAAIARPYLMPPPPSPPSLHPFETSSSSSLSSSSPTAIPSLEPLLSDQQSLRDILDARHQTAAEPGSDTVPPIRVRCNPSTNEIIISTNSEEDSHGLYPWDDLSPETQSTWKRQLLGAGHLPINEEEGEGDTQSILRGLLFGQACEGENSE